MGPRDQSVCSGELTCWAQGSITVSLETAVTGVQLSAARTMPQARRPPAYLPPSSTVKPKAIIVNKCGLSQRTNKKIKGYNISSLEKGQGRCLQLNTGLCRPVVTSNSNSSSQRGKMITLWTLYQALKLLERHAILNQRCDNWVGIIITSGLIMGFQKQSGGGVG